MNTVKIEFFYWLAERTQNNWQIKIFLPSSPTSFQIFSWGVRRGWGFIWSTPPL